MRPASPPSIYVGMLVNEGDRVVDPEGTRGKIDRLVFSDVIEAMEARVFQDDGVVRWWPAAELERENAGNE